MYCIENEIKKAEETLKEVEKRRETAKSKEEEIILWALSIRLDEKMHVLKRVVELYAKDTRAIWAE